MNASVIINTYNRAGHLQRLLRALTHLRDAAFEIVVVNGPSTDGTGEVLRAWADRIKVVDCPERNLSLSRNLGLAAAAGDIVVFIDDDALPADAQWLARFVRAFAAGPEHLAAVGGAVLTRDTENREFHGGSTSDYGHQRFSATDQRPYPGARSWVPGVPGGNAAFRGEALRAVGGFDAFFVYYLDETDVCLRLVRSGGSISYLSDNAIRHYAARSEKSSTGGLGHRWHVIARSDAYFAMKNGGDPHPLRFFKALASAPRKHYVAEIIAFRREPGVSRRAWWGALGRWLTGVVAGSFAGLVRKRALFAPSTPPAFKVFPLPAPQRPMTVALVTRTIPGQSSYGGVGRYTYDLAVGLHERGHEVHVFCDDPCPLRRETLGFTVHGVCGSAQDPVVPEKPVLDKNLRHGLAVARRVREVEQAESGRPFDVVHATNWDAEAAALIRDDRIPVVLTLVTPLAQTMAAEQWEATPDLQACVALDAWQIQHATLVCAPSRGVLKTYRERMQLELEAEPERLRCVPLGIVPGPAPAPVANRGRNVLLFVGRLEQRKGAHILLEILPALLSDFPDWECRLVGDTSIPVAGGGTLAERFRTQYAGAPWFDRAVLCGQVPEDELHRQYGACDVFVAPSLFESFGLIYHEAMQYGKPVVGCRTGGVPETVRDGEEGLLVEPGDAAALEAALRELMGDPARRERMGRAALRRVREEQNYRTMAAGYEAVYLEALARDGRMDGPEHP